MTLVKGDLEAPFSMATTRDVGESATPFHGLLYFTLDPYLIVLNVKQGTIFCVFGMTQLGIEFSSPRQLVNTLLISQWPI